MIKPYYSEPNIDIYLGDCLELVKEIPDHSIDLVLTDPPFSFIHNGGGIYKKRRTLERIHESFGNDFNPAGILNILKDKLKIMNGYFFCSKGQIRDYLNWIYDNNFKFNLLTWHKLNPVPANCNNFLPDTEYIIFIRGAGPTFNSGLEFKSYRKWDFTAIEKSKDHPTVKPISIINRFLKISSKENDLILDPFLGSGTTARACKDLGRKCIGIEINKSYCDIAIKRLGQEVFNFD